MSVQLYAADGRRVDIISRHDIERLDAAGRLSRIVRRRDGTPVRAYLYPRDGLECPVRPTAYMGQRYSFSECLSTGRVWTLRRLGRGNELRPIFLAVMTSCIRTGSFPEAGPGG